MRSVADSQHVVGSSRREAELLVRVGVVWCDLGFASPYEDKKFSRNESIFCSAGVRVGNFGLDSRKESKFSQGQNFDAFLERSPKLARLKSRT